MPFYYQMPDGQPGKRIAQGLLRLREQLDGEIPARTREETLLLATWNIREFDSRKYGERTEDALVYLAEIISRFDLVAVQEVRSSLTALDAVKAKLGDWWRYIVTDVTEGARGNQERMAFLFDARKVRFGGLSGEVVIPPTTREIRGRKREVIPGKQLYRTPNIAGFQAGWFKFMMSTVHILYGKSKASPPERVAEIKALADFWANRVEDPDAWSPNLILLGDFNIFRPEDPTFEALEDAGFTVPEKIQELPSNALRNRHYDQIAFSRRAASASAVEEQKAGVLDFFESVFRDQDEALYKPLMGRAYHRKADGTPRTARTRHYKAWRTFQMSDHLPLWVELKVDFGEEYLRSVAARR